MENIFGIETMTTYAIRESDSGTYITPIFDKDGKWFDINDTWFYLKDMDRSKDPNIKKIADALKHIRNVSYSVSSIFVDFRYDVWVPHYELNIAVAESKQKELKLDTVYIMGEDDGRYYVKELINPENKYYLDEIHIDYTDPKQRKAEIELDRLKYENIDRFHIYIDSDHTVWVRRSDIVIPKPPTYSDALQNVKNDIEEGFSTYAFPKDAKINPERYAEEFTKMLKTNNDFGSVYKCIYVKDKDVFKIILDEEENRGK